MAVSAGFIQASGWRSGHHKALPHHCPSPARMAILLLALALAGGCATAPPEPEITVMPAGPGEVEVLFELDRQVEALEFEHPADEIRRRQWQLLDKELLLQHDAIRSGQRQRFDSVRIRIESDRHPVHREYPPLIEFADGGMALHTRYLKQAGSEQTLFRVEAGDWHAALPGGENDEGRVLRAHDPERPRGSWLYLGPQAPSETDFGLLVSDPALPEALRKLVREGLEQAHAFFSERMGAREAPLLALAHHESAEAPALHGDFSAGPALRLAFAGPLEPNASESPQWDQKALLRFIAHETGHRWNADLVTPNVAGGGSWMVEGSSELFAIRFLESRGKFSGEAVKEEYEQALAHCSGVIETRPLAAISPLEPDYGAHYSCGMLFSLMTEAAFEPGDIFDFWQYLNHFFHEADDYDQSHYLGLLAEYGGARMADRIASIVTDQDADRKALLREGLAEVTCFDEGC